MVRSFRNLADAELVLPAQGLALLGANGHGKTNLIEALAYPVLFRSIRGARDRQLARFGGPGFHAEVTRGDGTTIAATWELIASRKRVTVGGVPQPRLADAIGEWLAVGFLPTDLELVEAGASGRRRWLDRMLSLADRGYLGALLRYRAAVAQRNAALRSEDLRSATAFDPILAEAGSVVIRARLDWLGRAAMEWPGIISSIGEGGESTIRYRGDESLAVEANWPEVLAATRQRDLSRGQTHVGPHRDDLVLKLAGHSLRTYGSTGQHRTAAVGLRLLEHATLSSARGVAPALLVDDVFAELDAERQQLLAAALDIPGVQLVVTAPREADLPSALEVPRWHVDDGRVIPG